MNVGDLVSIDELEREHIRQVIIKTKNLGDAARVLGIDAATLYRKRKRWGMGKDGSIPGVPAQPIIPREAHGA